MKNRFCIVPVGLWMILCGALFMPSAHAQEVDFDVPTQINIIQGRLSVAFNDSVAEQEARALVEAMGHEVLQASFHTIRAYSKAGESVSEEAISMLKSSEKVSSVSARPRPKNVFSTDGEAKDPPPSISVTFKMGTLQKEAEELLRKATSVPFSFTPRPSNELTIEVGDNDEEAFTALQAKKEVKWVTYVGVSSDG